MNEGILEFVERYCTETMSTEASLNRVAHPIEWAWLRLDREQRREARPRRRGAKHPISD